MLDERVVKIIVEELKWDKLTDIQEKAIPAIMSGANTVIVAPTGHGKTEAALLPILSIMVQENVNPVAMIYVTPLRALINDIYERIKWWASRLGFRVARKHGDVPASERSRRLRQVPHIIVTTPESLEIDLDWATRFREHYRNLRWVVVDEVHEIVSSKRGVQLAILLERLRRLAGDFQLILLSATIGRPELVGRVFAGSSKRPLTVVKSDARRKISYVIDYVEPGADFWRRAAEVIASHIEPLTLVFTNSKHVAERLHEELEKMGIRDVYVHHAAVSGEERERIEKLAKEGKVAAIICTKTLELGIDIGSVKKVILFRPGGAVSTLLQRVGRSGHTVGGESKGVIVATDVVELLEAIAEAKLSLQGVVEPPLIPRKPLDVAARSIVGMALAGGYTVKDVYEILRSTLYFEGLAWDEFQELITKLQENRLIKVEDGVLKPAAGFYRIWRFNNERERYAWWVRSFSEFFTLIGERDTFTVKTVDGKPVGELDTEYVFRLVRPGVTIRLGGKTWRVVSIDESLQRITVIEAEGETPTVPSWRGRGPEVSKLVAKTLPSIALSIVKQTEVGESIELTERAKAALDKYRSHVLKYGPPLIDELTLIVDRVGDEVVFVNSWGERVNRTIAYTLMARLNLDYARITFYGFSLPLDNDTTVEDVVKMLVSLSDKELRDVVEKIVPRTPYFAEEARKIQLSFGITRRLNPDDGIAFRETVRQVLEQYFDLEEALRIIEAIRSGSVRLMLSRGPNILSLEILREPPERLWSTGIEDLIASSIKGLAFTVDEIAEMIAAPPELVEAKLKELRKPGSRIRVFSFIDVDLNEERWALVEDARDIAGLEEFSSSFTPRPTEELYLVLVKARDGALIHITVNPKDLLTSPAKIEKSIPFNEIYELKIVPLTGLSDVSVKYNYVPKEIAYLLVLNAITALQKMMETDMY